MRKRAIPAADEDQRTLRTLFQLIAGRDRQEASRLLAGSSALARMVIRIGASRGDPNTYFFKEIAHYAYAGDTALHFAAAAYQSEVATQLLSLGADVRAKNRRGAEPLHYACDGSPNSPWWNPEAQAAVVALLIKAGADPNGLDKSGVAPLHRAVRTRCTGAVRALLDNGADVRRKNKSGSTPLHLAVQNTGRGGSGSAASRREQTAIIRLLLRLGARPSDKDAAGKSVIDCARAEWIRDVLTQG